MKILTVSRDNGSNLANVIRGYADQAQKRMWISSPYVGAWNSVSRVLGTRWQRQAAIDVRLLTDDSGTSRDLNETTLSKFQAKSKDSGAPAVRAIRGLHAKLYLIDDVAILSSANLTGKAFSKRHEIGVVLTGKAATEVIRVFEAWWQKARSLPSGWKPRPSRLDEYKEEPSGAGLRVEAPLPDFDDSGWPKSTVTKPTGQPELRNAGPALDGDSNGLSSPLRSEWDKAGYAGALRVADRLESMIREGSDQPFRKEIDPSLHLFLCPKTSQDHYVLLGDVRPFNPRPLGLQPFRIELNWDEPTVRIMAIPNASENVRDRWRRRLGPLDFQLGKFEKKPPAVRVRRINESLLEMADKQLALYDLLDEAIAAWRRR